MATPSSISVTVALRRPPSGRPTWCGSSSPQPKAPQTACTARFGKHSISPKRTARSTTSSSTCWSDSSATSSTQFQTYAELRAVGTELISATERIDNTPAGLLQMAVLAGVNAYRSRNDAIKIKDGLRKKAELGGTPNRTKLGYLNEQRMEGRNSIRYVVLDPDRSHHMQYAFQAFATGEWSLRGLVEESVRARPAEQSGRAGTRQSRALGVASPPSRSLLQGRRRLEGRRIRRDAPSACLRRALGAGSANLRWSLRGPR